MRCRRLEQSGRRPFFLPLFGWRVLLLPDETVDRKVGSEEKQGLKPGESTSPQVHVRLVKAHETILPARERVRRQVRHPAPRPGCAGCRGR